jgi:hypothetical protein
MYYVIAFLVGVIVGGICLFIGVMDWYGKLKVREREANSQTAKANEGIAAANAKNNELDELARSLKVRDSELNNRIISYKKLEDENAILKRDLQNIAVNLDKMELDNQTREQEQKDLDKRGTELAKRYLSDTVKAVVSSVGPSNFSACKQRLLDVIGRCREIGFPIAKSEEETLLSSLKQEFEKAVREEFARQEQARIKAQIREEERRKIEIDRELKQLERQRVAIRAALDQALAEAKGQYNAEVQRLQDRLKEVEENSKRTISMAEQTKAGHVYVISNIGTLGEGVFKVGMTRRLIPQERIDELGSASVPFPFDVHMMISCDNAPALENALHRALHTRRINRARPRKEFFRTDIAEIHKLVKEQHGEVEYLAEPEALEYHQSIAMSDEDADYIEKVYNQTADGDETSSAEDM